MKRDQNYREEDFMQDLSVYDMSDDLWSEDPEANASYFDEKIDRMLGEEFDLDDGLF